MVKAWLFTGKFSLELKALLESDPRVTARKIGSLDAHLRISTLEGIMIAKRGDWIVYGVQNEVYPCKPDIFKETYEQVH